MEGRVRITSRIEADDGPIDLALCGGVEALFVDPLYQLARLQLLAHAMERAGAADRVMVLVVVPECNADYRMRLPGVLRERYPRAPLRELPAYMRRACDTGDSMRSIKGRHMTFHRGLSDSFVRALNDAYTRGGWWKEAVDDGDLVPAIRDSSINLYWKGNSIWRLEAAKPLRLPDSDPLQVHAQE